MNLNRRSALALALGLGMTLPVKGLSASSPDLESLLSQAPWIGDGATSRRHAYVLFAPWCPFCKTLFQRTRAARDGIQLRWVAGGSRDETSRNRNLAIVGTRSLEVLSRVFRQEPVDDYRADSAAAARLAQSEATIREVAKQIEFIGYPTLVFTDARGLAKSIGGVPDDLDAVFAQVGVSGA